MQQRLKTYIPLFCLLVLVILTWGGEVLFGEGNMKRFVYLMQKEHRVYRFICRGIFTIIIFSIGYIGLKSFHQKWLVRLWILWYVLAAIIASIKMLVDLFVSETMGAKFSIVFSSVYALVPTVIPYIFLYLLALIAKKDLLRKP
jgi:hypothetical protein